MTYAIIANSKKLTHKSIDLYLKLYHAQYFPLIDKDKIYKKLYPELILLRVQKYSSPGDILGSFTQKISLSDRDIMNCIPINEKKMEWISTRTKNKLGYFDSALKELDHVDKQYTELDYEITSGIFFLAHYLFMIESDPKEISRKPAIEGYVLTDRFCQWKTKDKKHMEKWIGRSSNRKEQIVYSRFDYDDLLLDEEYQTLPLIKIAELLGFKIMFRVKNEIFETVSKTMFNSLSDLVEVLFVGEKKWKDRLCFELDLNFYNEIKKINIGEEELHRKPSEWSILN